MKKNILLANLLLSSIYIMSSSSEEIAVAKAKANANASMSTPPLAPRPLSAKSVVSRADSLERSGLDRSPEQLEFLSPAMALILQAKRAAAVDNETQTDVYSSEEIQEIVIQEQQDLTIEALSSFWNLQDVIMDEQAQLHAKLRDTQDKATRLAICALADIKGYRNVMPETAKNLLQRYPNLPQNMHRKLTRTANLKPYG